MRASIDDSKSVAASGERHGFTAGGNEENDHGKDFDFALFIREVALAMRLKRFSAKIRTFEL